MIPMCRIAVDEQTQSKALTASGIWEVDIGMFTLVLFTPFPIAGTKHHLWGTFMAGDITKLIISLVWHSGCFGLDSQPCTWETEAG